MKRMQNLEALQLCQHLFLIIPGVNKQAISAVTDALDQQVNAD